MTNCRATLALFALLVPLPACFDHVIDQAPNPYFADCAEHCTDDDWRLAAGGGHTSILAHGHVASVSSSDPAVLEVALDGDRIDAYAGQPGTAILEVVGTNGQVSHHTVRVDAAALLTVRGLDSTTDPVRVLEGSAQRFHVVTHAADGQVTRGDGSVQFTLEGNLALALVPLDGDAVGFTGTPGQGRVTARCTNASVSQEVTVLPASVITSLSSNVVTTKTGDPMILVAALSDQGPVYAGECTWKGMDPSVILTEQIPSSLDFTAASASTFTLTRPGSFTVTCEMAGRTTSVTLSR